MAVATGGPATLTQIPAESIRVSGTQLHGGHGLTRSVPWIA